MSKAFTTAQFIEKAISIHGDRYDYSKVNYINTYTNVIIICKFHNEMSVSPSGHLNNQNCLKCVNAAQTKTIQEFITEAQIKFGNRYDYSNTIYINSSTKVKIHCYIHGDFYQTPSNHLNRVIGCEACSIDSRKTGIDKFIIRANIKHNNKYDYSKSIYKNRHANIVIICKKHGEFEQQVGHHLNGSGCRLCSSIGSKLETEWLNMLNVAENYRNKRLKIGNKFIWPDAYDPKTNTVYEFYGDHWHGNPSIHKPFNINPSNNEYYGQLYFNTLKKEQLIKSAGYNLITIWETDYESGNKETIYLSNSEENKEK